MKRSRTQFIYEQWSTPPAVEHADLTGQTIIVVGANTGLGLEAAKHFARMKPSRLILACRTETKGKVAVESRSKYAVPKSVFTDTLAPTVALRLETGYKNAELWLIDLSKFSSVLAFADKFDKDGGRLDYLIMNAGIATVTYEATPDGWEST